MILLLFYNESVQVSIQGIHNWNPSRLGEKSVTAKISIETI